MGEWRRRADKSLATKCIVETQICHFYRWEVRPSRANAYKQAGSADRRWNVSKRSGSARCYAGTVRECPFCLRIRRAVAVWWVQKTY